MTPQGFQIVDGPSKFDLMLGLFSGTCMNPRRVQFFVLDGSDRTMLSTLLSGVSREDGSGESWLFTGHTNGKFVKGYFSTKTRKGHLELF